jgi:hypothetical protein
MKTKASLGALFLSAVMLHSGASAVVVGGRVYLDVNGNGQAEVDEPGVARVLVSDGVGVVSTAATGEYRLETTNASALVWVCVPRDHVAVGAFWRATDGKSRQDFGLKPQTQEADFTFIQITDAHVGRDDLVKTFAGHISQLPKPFAFVVNTGDLVSGVDVVTPDKAQAQYDRYLGAAAAFKQPLFNLPGNHEHVSHNVPEADKTHPFYGKGLYRRVFGPTYYSWDWAGVHFVALDGTTLPYEERLGKVQLAWLAADLSFQPADKPLVLFCHQSIPALRDARELTEVLRGHTVLGAFCGHLHRTFTTQLAGFPVYLTGALSGAWWSGPSIDGTPQGFRLVRIKGGALTTAYTNREGDCPISIVAPLSTAVQSGLIEVELVIADFGQPVTAAASFVGSPVALAQTSREELWSIWKGTVDTRLACDGDHVLRVVAKRGDDASAFEIRYLVSNGRVQPYTAESSATLKVQVRGIDAPDAVFFNGEPLGLIPADTPKETTLEFKVGKERLMKFNRVTLRAAAQGKGKDQFSVGPVWLEYKGKKIYDLRYASFERHVIIGDDPRRSEKELYFCLP